MDDIVKQALAKWPNVPHCWGWLALDARGNWWMRDERAQHAGPFRAGGAARGARLEHGKLLDFIGRNYAADAEGAWYFQNGPQRVYVELEAAPWVWRLQPDGRVASHTGADAGDVAQCLTDEAGRVYLATALGFGVVHSLDVHAAADALEAGRWPEPKAAAADALPQRFGFIREPLPKQ